MDFKNALIESANEVFPMLGLSVVFQGEIEEPRLVSANQVNILIGLSGGVKGSVVIGVNKDTALSIVSTMMGGMKIEYLNDIAKSAMSEFAVMAAGSAVGRLNSEAIVSFAPPTLITGDRLFLLISKLKANKLMFKIGENVLNISFSIEGQ